VAAVSGAAVRKQQMTLACLECLVLEPDQPAADPPLVIGLHGRGGSAEELGAALALLAPERFRLVLPNGPIPIVNAPWQAGHAWYVIGREQTASVAHARDLITALTEAVEQRYGIAREQIFLLGFAQGAVVALDVGLRAEQAYAGLIALSGYLFAPETLGAALRSGRDRRVLLLHGSYDDVMPVDGGRLARDVLEAAGLEPEYHELPLGHRLSQEALGLVRAFLERLSRPTAASTRTC
jgi:phospholipase/carboxylesterase